MYYDMCYVYTYMYFTCFYTAFAAFNFQYAVPIVSGVCL